MGGGPEEEGVGEAGSRHCARAPSAPVPGLQGAQRARPGPRPPDALPDTTLLGAWTTAHLGHCTGHCPPQGWTLQRTLLPSSGHCSLPPPPALDASPLPLRGPRLRAPCRLQLATLCTPAPDTISSHSPTPFSSSRLIFLLLGSEPRQFPRPPAARPRLPAPPSRGCSPGCLSPGDCGGSSAAVEALLFCTGTTGTASLAGTGTKTRTRRPLSYGPRVQRAAGG